MKMSLQAKRPRPTTSISAARQREPLAPTSTVQHSHPDIAKQGTHPRHLDFSLAHIPVFPPASSGPTTENTHQFGSPTLASQNRLAPAKEVPRQATPEDVQNENSVPDDLATRPAKYGAYFGHSLSRPHIIASGETVQPSRSGRPLARVVRQQMEASFGQDFSMVRIQEGPQASALHAIAYTQGTDIHFAPGSYQPDTTRGTSLLAHELTHVVQQRLGRVPGSNRVNADPLLEQEADQCSIQALEGKVVHLQQAPIGRNKFPLGESPIQLNGEEEKKRKGKREREEEEEYTPGSGKRKNRKVDPARSKAAKVKNEVLGKVGEQLIEKINAKNKGGDIKVEGYALGTSIPKIIATKEGQKQVSKPKSFKGRRKRQVKRHISTVIHSSHNRQNKDLKTMEIQAAHKKGEETTLGIAANENAVNERLRRQIKQPEDIRKQARYLIQNRPKKIKNPAQRIRELRQAGKLLRDQSGEFNKFTKVEFPAADEKEDIHAEVRLLNAGFIEAQGVKRPCVACAITLKKAGEEVKSVGPFWLSIGSLKPILEDLDIRGIENTTDIQEKDLETLADHIAETVKDIHLTYTSTKHQPTYDYDTESESELETTPASEIEEDDMELIQAADKEIKTLQRQLK